MPRITCENGSTTSVEYEWGYDPAQGWWWRVRDLFREVHSPDRWYASERQALQAARSWLSRYNAKERKRLAAPDTDD
jgi:hypothetical protein